MPTKKTKKIDNTFTTDKDDTVIIGTCEGCDADYDTAAHISCPHCKDDRRRRGGVDSDDDGPVPLDRMMGFWF